MPYRLKTRFAPTPSGYLHLGNAWSFVLTWLQARATGGTVRLRIDDLDNARFRDEYLEDIFESLRWLGLDWDSGPRDAAEFRASGSQRLRLGRYRQALDELSAKGRLYPCGCSREEVRRAAEAAGKPGHVYPGTCRDKQNNGEQKAEGVPGGSMRFRLAPGTARARDAEGAGFDLHPARDLGDFVLLQKNGDPGYQLASVIDDEDAGVNFIVRGLDLIPSTGAQLALAEALGYTGVPRARFWHHSLLLDDTGAKLGKSRGSESLRDLRARFPSPGPLYRFFGAAMGAPSASEARDLLEGFHWSRVEPGPLRLSDFWRSVGGP